MDSIVGFMQTVAGRTLRAVAGLVLIGVGWFVVGGLWGLIIALVGLVPLVAGAVGICLLAPLFGYTLTGEHHTRRAA